MAVFEGNRRGRSVYIAVSEDSHEGELLRLYILWETGGSVNRKGSRVAFPAYGIIYVHVASVLLQDSGT